MSLRYLYEYIDNWTSFTDVQKYKEKIDRVKENEDYAL